MKPTELPPELANLQRSCFGYFRDLVNPANGLVPDTDAVGSPASIAAVGMALTAWCVGAERGWMPRTETAQLTLSTLRFFAHHAPGTHGFYFHFLHVKTGARAWHSEVSSVDTGLLLLGMLAAGAYYDGKSALEAEIRQLCADLVARADWPWMAGGGPGVRLAWKPESGFSAATWAGYNEALILQILALGAPLFALDAAAYDHWSAHYQFKRTYGWQWAYCGPLFTHLYPHMWLDLRQRTDAVLGTRGLNYFMNTQRAIQVQAEYARRNPRGHIGYQKEAWGISACEGPINPGGRAKPYRARGVPFGYDDGTLSPPAALASYCFEPDLAMTAAQHFAGSAPTLRGPHGLHGGVHPGKGWTCQHAYGLDQGMLLILLENARSGLVWQIMEQCPVVQAGFRAAGFRSLHK